MIDEHTSLAPDGPVLLCAGTEPAAAARLAELTASLLADRRVTVVAIWEPPALGGLASVMDALYDTAADLRHAARDGAEQVARAAHDVLEAHGVQATEHVCPDERAPWQVILQLADDLDAAVIVAGVSERPAALDGVLGCQARTLAHHARRPLLLLPAAGAPTDADAPAIFAYDGSDPARHAISVAARLLRRRPALVTSVWQSTSYAVALAMLALPDTVAHQGAERLDETSRTVATGHADDGAAQLTSAGWSCQADALESRTAATAIIDAADAHDAAIVVTGTRGRSRITAALLGSTAESVLRYARRPVLLVPPPAE